MGAETELEMNGKHHAGVGDKAGMTEADVIGKLCG
jgi:hypothetical protein